MSKAAKANCDGYNAMKGSLKGYDCPVCLNKGEIAFVKDNREYYRSCDCSEIRKSLRIMEQSGLSNSLNEHSFAKYIVKNNKQKEFKEGAFAYCENPKEWFYVGGCVGFGKTHICTAIVGELLKKGTPCRYMKWIDESLNLKANVNDSEEYLRLINPLKTVPVLYIDDFFKTEKYYDTTGREVYKKPTGADIRLAYEILNYRYTSKLPTIISSERSVDEIIDIDMAIGSRIYERSKSHCFNIPQNFKDNYRLQP